MENLSQISNLTQKILSTIGAWKTKLLDLTKRNRALNFKPNKVSTVTIVDEHATEIFKLLCLQNKNLKFKAKPEDPSEKTPETFVDTSAASEVKNTPSNFDDEFYEEDLPSPDFVPYDSAVLADQYTDDYLQTNAVSEKLDKSLRRLDEQARSSQEEQGVNSLFLALGMLQYSESKDSKETYKAPLILVPVELERRSARAGYSVKKSDDETILNPSLIEYLRRNYNIILPDIPDSSVMAENYDLQTFFSDISESIMNELLEHRKAQLERRLKLGQAYQNLDFVFTTEIGTPIRAGNLGNRHFKPILKRAGLSTAVRLYDLRHTCATLLLLAKTSPKVVAERLGHSTVVLTLDTYSHVLPSMQKDATDELESMLFKTGSGF